MSLLLSTPEQHDYEDPTLDLDEKRLIKHLAGLPVLDPRASLQMILQGLEPLNEQRLDALQRLRLLAIYQPTVRLLFDTAAPLMLRKQAMSQRQRQETVDGVEALCLAMAGGYKIVIKELHAGQKLDKQIEPFGRALRGAMTQLGAALLHSYRYYRPQPPAVFLELNQVYRLARHHGLHNHSGVAENDGVEETLLAIYQALCMLALSDPFSAEDGQVDRRYRVLLKCAGKARIIPGNSWTGVPEGRYFIDLLSDAPPRHCVFLESPVSGGEPFLLDARPALEAMHGNLAGLPAERLRQRPEVDVLRHLLPEVASREKRAKPRRSEGHWIEVVGGLEAVHRMLQEQQAGQAGAGIRWRVLDSSETGYRLAWEESAASAISVGDLVCLVNDSDREQALIQLLVVRWIRDARNSGTELGVEVFKGRPQPVQLLVEGESGASAATALFLPSSGDRDCPARLIAATSLYDEDRLLTILVGERKVRVRCGTRVEQAPGFDCFEFITAE